jgi:hypothetical protein
MEIILVHFEVVLTIQVMACKFIVAYVVIIATKIYNCSYYMKPKHFALVCILNTPIFTKITIFCDVILCSLPKIYRHFRETHCRVSPPPKIPVLWEWRQYVPLKDRYISTRLYGVIHQKTVIFIVTTTGTAKLAHIYIRTNYWNSKNHCSRTCFNFYFITTLREIKECSWSLV